MDIRMDGRTDNGRNNGHTERYKKAIIRKRRNQKEIPLKKPRWEKLNRQSGTYTKKAYRNPSKQLFPSRRPLSYPNITKKYENVRE